MPEFAVHWIDAFASGPFGGNGCAVVHDAAHLDANTCTSFVRETSLVECTFLGPSEVADLHVRYFLASREIPFAGHPTIASVLAALDHGSVKGPELTLETGAGIIAIRVEGSGAQTRVIMRQIAPTFGPQLPADIVAAAGGLQLNDIVGTPQVVSTGLPFCITVLRDHDALNRAVLQPDGLAAMAAHLGVDPKNMMEPFWVTLSGATPAGDTFSRLLMAPPSPPEDPFTGSATGAMAAYLWHHGLLDAPQFTAEQGHMLGRAGQAQVSVLGPRDAITGVDVSGTGHILMRGSLHL